MLAIYACNYPCISIYGSVVKRVDRTGSGSCAVVSFGISGVKLLCSATGELVNW
jgi:hypothetical protein